MLRRKAHRRAPKAFMVSDLGCYCRTAELSEVKSRRVGDAAGFLRLIRPNNAEDAFKAVSLALDELAPGSKIQVIFESSDGFRAAIALQRQLRMAQCESFIVEGRKGHVHLVATKPADWQSAA